MEIERGQSGEESQTEGQRKRKRLSLPLVGPAAQSRELSVQHRPGRAVALSPVQGLPAFAVLGQAPPQDTCLAHNASSAHLAPSVSQTLAVCAPLRNRCGGKLMSQHLCGHIS